MYRRDFLASTAAATAALAAGPAFATPRHEGTGDAAPRPPVGVFTKSFQDWPIPKVCQAFAELGLDGLDLTVRPSGHIEPENAAAKLPGAVAAAEAAGVQILQLTTGVTDAGPDADRLFGAAAENGVPRLKLGYFRQGGAPLNQRMDEVRKTLAQIARLAEKHGVTPCLHVHSGDYLPSHGTMLYALLKDLPPERIGAYVDTLHMHVEGGDAGWRQGLELLAPWIKLCAVKNYRQEPAGRGDLGMAQWKKTVVPVADGFSPIPAFVKELNERGFAGPFSLHSEYQGGHSFEDLNTAETLEQTRQDWAFFQSVLGEVYS
ncbi:sugar phosphate isomerase/epimerase family protein [Alienimonas californiensis]|uniref:Xylose isomerase-like TIM barrel n=1 Tax=Alienimonas californiensis TaxID=2527989 RepID=A0A517P4K5_9PLAN|nr:TIM barrel protein [Alienimonas californiensis]QDT14291.1 Xylose isomerase-like TIM barrel [Alienimonas californiensis]